MKMYKKKTLSIIGLGRFGCFWAKRLSNFFEIKVYDLNTKKSEECNFEQVSLDEIFVSDYIYLTIPIRNIEKFVSENAEKISGDSTIIDAASIKTPVVKIFEKYLNNHSYVFTHPLFGPDSGANGLKGLSISVLPGKISFGKYSYLIDVFEKAGLTVLPLSADEHDYLMAYNLNLIHLLGRTLAEMGIEKIPLKMNALLYLNGMSKYVVNDSRILFEDFFKFNPYAGKIKNDLVSNLNKIINSLP